jgi:uncharacterized protein DUF2516
MIGWLLTLLALVTVVLCIWALVDAAVRPKMAFEAAGQNKALWIILPIGGLLLLGPIGGILGAVYLWVIRPKIRGLQRY